MATSYIALIHPPEAEGGSWGVTFPDLPGCTSAGDSFEAAAENAREALAGHVAAMRADGDDIPAASSYARLAAGSDEFRADQDAGAKAVPIPLDNVPAPKERINIMIDPGVLRRIDAEAKLDSISRSVWIERAAQALLGSRYLVSVTDDPNELLRRNILRR
ncbi:MAG: CopG family transcriptional regulator [Stutzerimonas stutzeri]|nr:MAG: CopG family transcriptional regulator [Stutzerimonas stutzeri]